MAGPAAVGVDDDLATGQSRVAHRAAQDELAGRVHQHPSRRRVQRVVGQLLEHSVEHLLADIGIQRLLQVDIGGVLGGDDHGIQPHRDVVLVGDGDLGLAVRTQIWQHAVLTNLGQPPRQPVGQRDGQRHQLRGVVDGVAEHQALIAGALRVQRVGGALDAVPRGRCPHPGRYRATARRYRCSPRTMRRRSPCPRSRSRFPGCARAPCW